ncbi:hypothetical protein [Rhodothermus marinus]|uniref:hypothetical protein n=1 Tax=Rhodothermus marinus TaxID=29549 RepID=UPI000223DE28|nr:hypothetical protein [Rhodothermus marinus]AEN74438.1 hypothetical protein Rhom172_2549 [Rhodothermus marinus SG0.5JP17-172]MBO2493187.1 hypothetical protein [Rhodothermus marinus]BBM70872.1 hypothetical protein RmaAA213_27180 [Rhodothermus marinus]BBM73851.1 hypothetical protein RmaAA338_27160 [Rhodothermus marinus]
MVKGRALAVALGLLLAGSVCTGYGQPAAWWGVQAKAVGGVGVMAEGPLGDGLRGTLGAGWLLLIVDGFAGATARPDEPVNLLGRLHLMYMASFWDGEATVAFGLEPGVRVWLPGRRWAIEGGLIGVPRWKERLSGGPGRDGLSRRRVLQWDLLPNVGLVMRLGRIRD